MGISRAHGEVLHEEILLEYRLVYCPLLGAAYDPDSADRLLAHY